MKKIGMIAGVCVWLAGCTPSVPVAQQEAGELPGIYPDYVGVTVPVNIAPLRFGLEGAAEAVAVLTAPGEELVERADEGRFLFPQAGWKKLLEAAAGDSIAVKVYEKKDGVWTAYPSFGIHVSAEAVDEYLAYRLIPPGYEQWHRMGIYQRNLSTFEEETIVDNSRTGFNCMNCHAFRSQSPDEMLLHMRADYGGTYLWKGGQLEKLEGWASEDIPSLVYPYWHPSGDYIAFSTNQTSQMFHMADRNRIEVFDASSDVLVYDVRHRRVLTDSLLFSKEAFETFPCFAPDGKTLYFCSASARTMPKEYREVRYNICAVSFDPETGRFGQRVDTIFQAERTGKTAVFPRVSPDGTLLVFTQADYGNFSIWHKEADLYAVDLRNGEVKPLDALNSPEAESYHSWSSNGRWLVFSSRRGDGLYTRPYIAYIDKTGRPSKPFVVPQRTPEAYLDNLKSYNVPEFIQGPVQGELKVKN